MYRRNEEMEIEINPFLRFNKILSNIIDINIKKDLSNLDRVAIISEKIYR